MVIHRQCHSNKDRNCSSTRLTIPSKSHFLSESNDFIWNNPIELDLLNVKKAPLMTTIIDNNYFLKVLPSIRRLYTVFNSICPNIYRIHCSDSTRILQEIICLIEKYLHLHLPSTILVKELLYNEKYFDDFIHKLRFSSFDYFHPNLYSLSRSKQTHVHCFGQGIHEHDDNNELNQTILFCFELVISKENDRSLPINILILDPNENIVSNDIQYINTYDHGYTKLFSCRYKPITQAGVYKINFFYNYTRITDKPFAVYIRNSEQSNEKNFLFDNIKMMNIQEIPEYELEGDGCSTKVIVNSIVRFRLRIKSLTNRFSNSIVDLFSLTIIDPFGHKIVVQRRTLSSDLLELTYQPMSIGEYRLSISFNNKFHRQLIIDVINDETNYLSKLKPFGPGLKRAITGLPAEFYVDLSQRKFIHNDSYIQFSLEPSYYGEIDYEQQIATVRYMPLIEGDCPIHILEDNKDILHSPFIARIKKEDISHHKPRVYITGVSQELILHRPVEFQVFVDNPFNDLNYSVHVEILTEENSPSVSIYRRHRSSYTCSFIPITLGRHLISIDYAGIVVENNPFSCHVIQEKDIQLTGPAVNDQCLTLNKPTHFYFQLEDFLKKNFNEKYLTYESGYSSNDDTSLNSSLTDGKSEISNNEHDNYRVTITDGHGNIKPNVSIKHINEKNMNDKVRVDFTPDEKILFINISCTCSITFEPPLTSTPKKFNFPNFYSIPRSAHVRCSLTKCAPLPIDSSTPYTKTRKSLAPNIERLIYRSNIATIRKIKIWIL